MELQQEVTAFRDAWWSEASTHLSLSGGFDFHWSAYQGQPVYADGTHRHPTPTEIVGNWQALNASGQAARLQGKLLLQFGKLDENVPPAQIMTFVSALIK